MRRTVRRPKGAPGGLVAALRRLQKLEARIELLKKIEKLPGDWRERVEDMQLSHVEKMADLAWEAASLKAQNLADLEAKAMILREWCIAGDGDIVHDLADSLCRDLMCRNNQGNPLFLDANGEDRCRSILAFQVEAKGT